MSTEKLNVADNKPEFVFDETGLLHRLMHYLPAQTPLKDFIHHNTLHAFQHQSFYQGIFKASAIFGWRVTLQLQEYRTLWQQGRITDSVLDRIIADRKGYDANDEWRQKVLYAPYECDIHARVGKLRACWEERYHIHLDDEVQPLLFRILCSYLDQGVASWKMPVNDGLLESIRELEKNSLTSLFKTSRVRRLLQNKELSLAALLEIMVGQTNLYEQYLFDQQFSHQGWSGMVAAIEQNPHTLLAPRKISLRDLIMLELLLEMDALEHNLKGKWQPIAKLYTGAESQLWAPAVQDELSEVYMIWQDAFEWSYYDQVIAALAQNVNRTSSIPAKVPTFQAIFCIDERECSLRRYIEQVDKDCETYGTPGFFGVEFYFQALGAQFYEKLCPAPVTPKYLVKELGKSGNRLHDPLYTVHANSVVAGILVTLSMGYWALLRLFANLFKPVMSPAISNAFAHMQPSAELLIENRDETKCENGLQVGFTIPEMAQRVEAQLRSIGLVHDFAEIVYIVAHGSSSANNPHHSAHDCGACSGRPGSVNARVLAFMANHPKVRSLLAEKNILIPASTIFIGAMHDTAADQIQYYDAQQLKEVHLGLHKIYAGRMEQALDLNARERSRRFASINTKGPLHTIRQKILRRSVSLFEPRPELGHGTNTLCIVGNRSLTRGLFLDRRAFLNSYDYRTDPEGDLLIGVMKPLGPVCGGINLEYYFSRVDNFKLGAGTKLPHNVMGLIGVANSCDGDLRPGLPVQMIEVHDPVRLLIIVEHDPEVILAAIQNTPETYEWYKNEWVHLLCLQPETGAFLYFKNGRFTPYKVIEQALKPIDSMADLIRHAPKMVTNQIADATKENMPVYLLN